MREGVTKYFEFFTPEFRLSVLQAAVLCDGVVSRRRSAGQESQIMIHNTPSRSAVLVTNAVTVILNTKRQTSYWTFVQCCDLQGQLFGCLCNSKHARARKRDTTTHECGSWIDERIVGVVDDHLDKWVLDLRPMHGFGDFGHTGRV